uniref:Protein phosphatase 1 regulatory subunit 21 n=1 Tax=Bactrocera latifrons TaxID=174628 RepID=A0A0K8VE48_BACLA
MLSRMDGSSEITEAQHKKYQKLASEYSKLRARAAVLRNAVLDEQSKGESLREQLRQSETALRRSEQEVDSLGFRNRQLEHRVAALQDEIAKREGRIKTDNEYVRKHTVTGKGDLPGAVGERDVGQDALIFEELQKKIMENAELTTMVDDKEHELQIQGERLLDLQKMLEKRNIEFTESEKHFRRDFEVLQKRNTELESKLVDAISMLGSEDALSASGSDHTPFHVAAQQHDQSTLSTASVPTAEERICSLEKEMVHWRTQYEILKINEATTLNETKNGLYDNNITCSSACIPEYSNCSCSSTAAGLIVKSGSAEAKSSRDSYKEPTLPPTKEEILYNSFSKKFEHLLKSKYLAESRMFSYETEVEHFQICLENATHELNSKDEQIGSINQALKILEEDLATTRINYEEQISVLTEQVISLSEQLAASK